MGKLKVNEPNKTTGQDLYWSWQKKANVAICNCESASLQCRDQIGRVGGWVWAGGGGEDV